MFEEQHLASSYERAESLQITEIAESLYSMGAVGWNEKAGFLAVIVSAQTTFQPAPLATGSPINHSL